jgi:hypothetical protein
MQNENLNYCITRVDITSESRKKETHGWEVRVRRRGMKVEKFFSDNLFGGKDQALASAREFRNGKLNEIKPYTRLEIAKQMSIRNTSGIVGVHYTKHLYKKRGRTYEWEAWVATWSPEPKKERSKRFSVKKYGEIDAFNRAVEHRRKMLEELALKEIQANRL